MSIRVQNYVITIGQSILSGTGGSVLYIDSNKNIAQDNSNLFWDATNKRLGIGTAVPGATIDFIGSRFKMGTTSGSAMDLIEGTGAFIKNSTAITFQIPNATTIVTINGNGMALKKTSVLSSAILDLGNSTTQGFLPPVTTTTQKNAISTPATGLVVYDSTLNKLCVYTGAVWETVTSV